MRKVLRLTAISIGALLALVFVAGAVLYVMGGSRLNRHYDIQPPALTIPTSDSAAIARGRHLAEAVILCHGCHGDNLAGDVIVDEPVMATIYASNLTAGRGGIGTTYSDADLVRAIRHGVNRQGRALLVMHADTYNRLAAEDLGAIVAHVRSVAPVDNELPATRVGPLGRIFVALGLVGSDAMPVMAAEHIDHDAPFP